MAEPDQEEYGDIHRALIQIFLARRVINDDEMLDILRNLRSIDSNTSIEEIEIDEDDVIETISRINRQMKPYDLEITSVGDQVSNQKQQIDVLKRFNRNINSFLQGGGGDSHPDKVPLIWVLVNLDDDLVAQLGTNYTPDELAFFRAIVQAIVVDSNSFDREVFAIDLTSALNLSKNAKITKSNAQILIDSFSDSLLLTIVTLEGKTYLTLSTRSLAELKTYLINTYYHNDNQPILKSCHVCNDLVTCGLRCPDKSCNCRLHTTCSIRFFRAARSTICPVCKIQDFENGRFWPVGIAASTW